MKIKKKTLKEINGLNIFFLECGKRSHKKTDIILFLHGFPELSYSFRHLMLLFAKKGYYCVAPDQRGYGETTLSKNFKDKIINYSIFNLTKDIHDLIVKLGFKKVNIVGHDFGSYVAGYFSILYPQLTKSLSLMSMPFEGTPSQKTRFDHKLINKKLNIIKPARKHYQIYFSNKTANRNMTDCKQGVFNFLRAYYHFKSFDYKDNKPHKLKSISPQELIKMPEYYIMRKSLGMAQTVKKYMPNKREIESCQWMTNKDLKVYSDSFIKNSFKAPLNWYKMMLDEKEKKSILNFKLPNFSTVPVIFLAGTADWGVYQKPGQLENMKKFFKKFFGFILIKKAGHWVQQEKPKETFQAIYNFYKELP